MKIRTDFPLPQTALQTHSQQASQLAGNGSANTMANFASLLQQQGRAPSLVAPAPAVVAAPPKAPGASEAGNAERSTESSANESSESSEAADEAAAEESASKPRPPGKPRVRQAETQAPARATREETSASRSEKRDTAANDDATVAAATASDPTTRSDATIPPWLAGLMPPPAAQAPGGARRSTGLAEVAEGADSLPGETDAAAGAAGGTGAGRGRGLPAGAKKADAREALDAAADADRGTVSASKEAAINTLPGFAAVLSEQRLGEQRRAEPAAQRDAAMPSIAGADGTAAAHASSSSSTTQDAAGTANAHVRAAVGSPEFPQELGVQLSVLARDGIQQAELHLNPSEMGPVSVQIVMDGTQARIDFGADMAATRQAIEAGLPELASALRDAGFTLAGGGVSQHAGGRQGSDGDGARRDGGSARGPVSGADAGDRTPRTVRTRVSAGGVDLYA